MALINNLGIVYHQYCSSSPIEMSGFICFVSFAESSFFTLYQPTHTTQAQQLRSLTILSRCHPRLPPKTKKWGDADTKDRLSDLVNATDCLLTAASEEETVVAHGHGFIVTRQGGGGGERAFGLDWPKSGLNGLDKFWLALFIILLVSVGCTPSI